MTSCADFAAPSPGDSSNHAIDVPTAHNALRRGTHIFSWGRGDLGQLGTELDQSQSQPVLVQAVEDKDIAHVAASAFNSAFVTGAMQAPAPCAGSNR